MRGTGRPGAVPVVPLRHPAAVRVFHIEGMAPDRIATSAPNEPDRGWMWWGAAVALALLFAIRLTFVIAFELAEGTGHIGPRVFDEITGTFVGVLPVGILAWILQRLPVSAATWKRSLLVIGGTFVPISLMHTWLLVHLRAALGPTFGYTQYDATVGPARYIYEGATNLVHLIAIVAVFTVIDLVLARRERDRRNAILERSLTEADLRALRLRLEPHFLFNALNTISATMYEDVPAADAQLAHLASLLRAAVRTADAQEVPLADELEVLEHYVALLRARFEDRLVIAVDVAPEATRCLVPSLLLQPLVENAIRHGGLERSGAAVVRVTISREASTLRVVVHDDGPGLAPGRDPRDTGTGLSATIQRLRLLYGDARRVRVGNVPGGFEVAMTLPAREGADATSANAVASVAASVMRS